MIPGDRFVTISPYLIREERQNIFSLWPSQCRNHDPEEICFRIWTNVKWMVEFLRKFQGRGIKIGVTQLISPLLAK